MYNETYEEYIRSILGYPNQQPIVNTIPNNYIQNNNNRINRELEKYYPEIYKVLYPMVKKICMDVTEEITKEQIEKMTEEIYSSFENTENINTNNRNQPTKENKEENRNVRNNNPFLKDLIRILLLRELIGNSRPIFNTRPPFQPGFPTGPRPPIMPRNEYYQNLNNLYE